MAKERKVMLTMQQRMDAMKDLETSNIAYVAEKYKVHRRTIERIKSNAVKINNFAKRGILEKRRKTFREPTFEELEQRLYVWFAESRAMGNSVTDALLLEKAAELKKEFASCSNAKLSSGWLLNFKRRHYIRLVRTGGVKTIAYEDDDNSFLSSDEEESLSTTFEDTIEDNEESNEQRDKEGATEEGDEARAAEERDKEGVEEVAAKEVDEAGAIQEGVKERDTKEVDLEGATEEANEERGLNLPTKIRKIFENSFNDMESCKKYIPPSVRCILDGLKLRILGGTYNKE